MAGRELVLHERKGKEPPNAEGRGGPTDDLAVYRELFLTSVWLMSADHIGYLQRRGTGAPPERGPLRLEAAPELKSHLAALFRAAPGELRDKLFQAVDVLVERGRIGRHIDVPA